ncbi:MAG: tRNA lysidine(34) synthetase TilS [Dehalococcoidia bacterium]
MKLEADLSRRVKRFITANDLFTSSRTLLTGVSGGPDSVCLLYILDSLRSDLGLDLHVVHLNHQLRGAESDGDADCVMELAGSLGLNCTIERRDVKRYQAERGCSLEEAAREVRYDFFAEVAAMVGADTVAVGHTADDQAETIIMHLVRGTGLSGLQGMRPVFEWGSTGRGLLRVVRPLLQVRREEVNLYCEEMGLHPRTDLSNHSPDYLRNRVRAEIMPQLAEYNPNVVDSLSRTAYLIGEDVEYLSEQLDRVFDSVVETVPEGVALDNRAFAGLAPALKRRLLRTVLAQLIGSLRDIEMVHIESVMEVMEQPAGKELSLPYGLSLYGDYEKSFITGGENPLSILPAFEGEAMVQIPGETSVSSWKVTAEVLPGRPQSVEEGDLVAFFDLDITGGNLTVRSRKDGDRFQPLGMDEAKKLQDFMVDAKIPRDWRDSVPLVCSNDRIIWVVGWRIDHRSKVTDFTQRTLRLEFEME